MCPVYILLSLVLGGPVLLLEMFLGQYSALAPLRLHGQLAPAMAGVGVAVCVQAATRAVLELGVMMWSGQVVVLNILLYLFPRHEVTHHIAGPLQTVLLPRRRHPRYEAVLPGRAR